MTRMRSIVLAAVAVVASPAAFCDAVDDTMNKAGCMACHAPDKKVIGPSFKEIAAKRKGDANAVATLAEKVRKGGTGVYGQIPMPPNAPDKISDAEIKAAVDKILKS